MILSSCHAPGCRGVARQGHRFCEAHLVENIGASRIRRSPPKPASLYVGPDYCLPEHAATLAANIRAYWRKQGIDVNIRIESLPYHNQANIHCIRSDVPVTRGRDNVAA